MSIYKTVILAGVIIYYSAGATDWQKFYAESPRQTLALQETISEEEEEDVEYEVEYIRVKSPGKAALFSAVIPGSGQLYAGSYIKSAGFLAIEAASIYMYLHYDQQGKDLEDEFEQYADTHWSEDKYWDWIAHQSGVPRDDLTALRAWEHDHFSHGLHENKDQQYYEMIGKYDQFNVGWDDIDYSQIKYDNYTKVPRSSNRLNYEGMRKDSNAAFKNATTSITITMINHLLSALDAAWTVTRHNRQVAEASLFMQPKLLDQRSYAALTLQIKW